MGNWALNWLAAHQDWLMGIATGMVLSNPVTCGVICFNLALKIPGVGSWVAKNPDQAKGWFDGFDKGVDQAVDKYVASQAAKPVVAPGAAGAAAGASPPAAP